jgi:hypothetical protein
MSQPWYEVGKWSIDANMSPMLGEALTDFTSRMDERLFAKLSEEAICIVDCAPGASTVRVMGTPCLSHEGCNDNHNVYLLVFRPETGKLSRKAALGEVAHQFAHLVLRLDHGVDSESLPAGEEMADTLATNWGFEGEIEARIAEWKQLGSQGAAAGPGECQAATKLRKKKSGKAKTS